MFLLGLAKTQGGSKYRQVTTRSGVDTKRSNFILKACSSSRTKSIAMCAVGYGNATQNTLIRCLVSSALTLNGPSRENGSRVVLGLRWRRWRRRRRRLWPDTPSDETRGTTGGCRGRRWRREGPGHRRRVPVVRRCRWSKFRVRTRQLARRRFHAGLERRAGRGLIEVSVVHDDFVSHVSAVPAVVPA